MFFLSFHAKLTSKSKSIPFLFFFLGHRCLFLFCFLRQKESFKTVTFYASMHRLGKNILLRKKNILTFPLSYFSFYLSAIKKQWKNINTFNILTTKGKNVYSKTMNWKENMILRCKWSVSFFCKCFCQQLKHCPMEGYKKTFRVEKKVKSSFKLRYNH
jgi:hypothetical protein